MPQLKQKIAAQQRKLWASVVVALLILGLALVALLYNERNSTIARETDRLLAQTRVIDANLGKQLEGVNAALNSVRAERRGWSLPTRASPSDSRHLSALVDAMPGVRTMLITDDQGKVIASNRAEVIGFDASKRPYFQMAKEGGRMEALYVSEPFKTTLGVFSLNMVKNWADDKGQFAGVISATLDPEYFDVLLRSVVYADDMQATLIHGQGRVLLTRPSNPTMEGAHLAVPGTHFSNHTQSGRSESLSIGWVEVTGDDRMIAYRTVQPVALQMNIPLVLAVSRQMAAVMAPWHYLALVCGLTYGLISVVILLSVYLLLRKQKALMDLTRLRELEAREHAERLDMAVGGADLGLWDVDLVSGVRRVNARSLEMVGDAPDSDGGTLEELMARVHPDDLPEAHAARMAHQRGLQDALIIEYRVRHRDGRWVYIHSRGKVTHRSDDGEPLRMMGTHLDITERKAAEAKIAEFAFYDPLTQLPNRRLLMDRLAQAQHASARSKQPAALMFLDLDRFKWVNDTLGHDMGDLLLQQVAERLLICVRQTDTVARLGGDEFVLILQQLGESQQDAAVRARALADKVLEALRKPMVLGDTEHVVTTSIGVAIFCGESQAPGELLKLADKAMYQAKAAGRNQVCLSPLQVEPSGELLPNK
ncbi:MAG: diguanylate cyclase [Rhodoferax sp.]|nr:diguanylate cyclase [Rhodoferax sp.]